MGFFSALTCPLPVAAINYGMKPNLKFTIHDVSIDGVKHAFSNPYLMVGKGHIRVCSTDEDIPPFTVRISSFKEFKMYGVKHYQWTLYNQSAPNPFQASYSDVGKLVLSFENKSVAIWHLYGTDESAPVTRIVTDRRSF